MSTPMADLIEHAKEKSRESCEELTGPEDDVMPILLFLGPRGLGVMPLGTVMADEDSKEEGALWMTASLAVARAEQAVMVTTAWMVTRERDDPNLDAENARMLNGPVSEQPDRTEHITLMCSDIERDQMIHAPITRYPDKPPTLGEWVDEDYADRLGGRFGDAINLGLKIAKEMPPEMAEIVDEGWEDGTSSDLVERFVKVARQFTGPPERDSTMGVLVVHMPDD
jgi:hypothetical protein